MKLTSIVRKYDRNYRRHVQDELQRFESQPSLQRAIEYAALAINSRGKRYSHQRRLKRKTLEQALEVLLEHKRQLSKAKHFDDVFYIVETALEDVFGVGELYIYDTSLRIGANLGLSPSKIYLHAGTRVGARAPRFRPESEELEQVRLASCVESLRTARD